jgi:drug/metabolite transporter (DMT)-like permease
MQSNSERNDRPWLALVWMAASALGFGGMSIFVKLLSEELPQFELVFFRSFVNFLIVLLAMWIGREKMFPPGKKLLFFRGLVGLGGIICHFYSIAHLPLAVAYMLNWASPIFVILFSRLFLDERISRRAWPGFVLSFLGLALLMRPQTGMGVQGLAIGAVGVALLGAAFGGLAYVAVRVATARVGVNAIILYFTGTASLLSAPLALISFQMPNFLQLIQLVLLGVCASVGQFTMTQAYRHALAGTVSTMGLLNAVSAALLGWVFFGETLSWIQLGGMMLLGVGVGALAMRSRST